jgi:predicted transcriptional regulator of viral defense system
MDVYGILSNINCDYGQATANVTKTRVSTNRLLSIVNKKTVVRARDLYRSGIHPEALSRALQRGLLLKIGWGLYARKDFSANFERQIMRAYTRVPNGIVCLKSAVRFHGLLPLDSASIWIAIDPKAKKPVINGPRLRFVRFSGEALTQGVVNTRIDGVPVRIYSAAKTIADCLKYRKKLGGNIAGKVLREGIARRKCSEQRLRHFARICRVGKLVHAAYSLVAQSQH